MSDHTDIIKSEGQQGVPYDVSLWIDFLRGISALGVIWGHTIYGDFPNLPVFEKLQINGVFWVWIFLVLSGYLVGKGLFAGRYRYAKIAFLWNRSLRIIPLTYLALFIGLIIHYSASREFSSDTVRQFLFVPSNFNMALVGPLWTIAVEMQFYFFCALMLLLFQICKVEKCIKLITGLLFLASLLFTPVLIDFLGDDSHAPRSLLGNILFFSVGMLTSFVKPIVIMHANSIKMCVLFITVAFVCYLEHSYDNDFWLLSNSVLIPFADSLGIFVPFGLGAYLAIFLALICLVLSSSSSNRSWSSLSSPIRWVGHLCFGVYVTHSVLAVAAQKLLYLERGFVLFGIVMLAVPIAAISYRWIEKPLLKFKL